MHVTETLFVAPPPPAPVEDGSDGNGSSSHDCDDDQPVAESESDADLSDDDDDADTSDGMMVIPQTRMMMLVLLSRILVRVTVMTISQRQLEFGSMNMLTLQSHLMVHGLSEGIPPIYGVVVVISWDTGRVLVLSKHCQKSASMSGKYSEDSPEL